MDNSYFIERLRKTKIICVVRTSQYFDLRRAFSALIEGGIDLIEITATCPEFAGTLDRYVEHIHSLGALCGVGTIVDMSTLEVSLRSKVDFVVSPIFEHALLEFCNTHGTPMIPGCMTPTEIHVAWRSGAPVIKTFPGRVCTPEFYRDVLGPFPDIKMIPTGNVNEKTAPEYIRNGAIGVGVGKALLTDSLIADCDWKIITGNAKHFLEIVKG